MPVTAVPASRFAAGVRRSRPAFGTPWAARIARRLRVGDAVVLLYALLGAHLVRFGAVSPAVAETGRDGLRLTYITLSVVLGVAWFTALGIADSRNPAVLGVGAEEYRRVIGATVKLFAVLAIAGYLSRIDLARGYLAIAFPVGTVLLLFQRWLWRQWLVGMRRSGCWTDTVLAVGTAAEVGALAAELTRVPAAGMRVVGACLPQLQPGPPSSGADPGAAVPVLGCVGELRVLLERHAVHTVAVTAGADVSTVLLRRIGLDLEGTGVRLVVTPALTNIAGTRIHIQPLAGLALLHVAEPRLPRGGQLAKDVTDRLGALVLIAALAPVLAAVAVAVATCGTGPVFYRQDRIGCRGTVFSVWKFRSMRPDADGELTSLLARNEQVMTPFVKPEDDPRVTAVGRFLRRSSLDELPQLFNVVLGQMSLVGPRPQRAAEVALYDDLARRRLLTKPGMTGYWQVSGRNDLSWEESVRLDLYYVENWSYLFDLVLLARTFWAVLRGRGAR